MADYETWREFEKEFRGLQEQYPSVQAVHSSVDGKWIRFSWPISEKNRFRSLCTLAATASGFAGESDPIESLLDAVKEYLLEHKSPLIRSSREELQEGNHPVALGQVHVIRSLFQALADYCLERASQAMSVDTPAPLPVRWRPPIMPKNWEEVEIRFLSDHRVEIRVAGQRTTQNYSEMGFQDRRSGNPNGAWQVLRTLAVGNGVLPEEARIGKIWVAAEKRIERTRKELQKRFGLSDDPLPYIKGLGYRARFKTECVRSFKQ